MKTDRQALEEAIELIDNPEHWTQGQYARDQKGKPVYFRSELAESWCAVGALRRVAACSEQRFRVIEAIIGSPLSQYLVDFNDSHSYDEVMLAMKRGLDNLE